MIELFNYVFYYFKSFCQNKIHCNIINIFLNRDFLFLLLYVIVDVFLLLSRRCLVEPSTTPKSVQLSNPTLTGDNTKPLVFLTAIASCTVCYILLL